MCSRISFLFKAESCSIVWKRPILVVCSSADGYLGCFYLLVTVNRAAVNMGVQDFWFSSLSSSVAARLVGLLGRLSGVSVHLSVSSRNRERPPSGQLFLQTWGFPLEPVSVRGSG